MAGSRSLRLAIALALALVAALPGAAGAQDWSKLEVATTELAPGLWHLESAGGHHLVLAGEGGLLVTEAGYAEMAGKLLAALAALDRGPVRLVVDTHWHFDHAGANAELAAAGALVAAHETVRRDMAADQVLAVIDTAVPASPPEALPHVTFADGLTLHWGGEEVRIRHLPRAHSDGDVIVQLVQADVIATGDVFWNCGYPFVDIDHGGTIDGLIAGAEAVLALCGEGTRVVPGHGPAGGRQDVAEYVEMLRGFRAGVAAARAEGRSLESIVGDSPTAELDATYGRRFFPAAAFAEMVYRTLP
jgi:cyclase